MKLAKLPWLALILLAVGITLAAGCSQAGAPPTGGVPPTATRPEGGTPLSRSTTTPPPPAAEAQRYSTRELKLASRSPQGMILWEGKVIYTDACLPSQPGRNRTSRIVEHDLATGRETVLIEPRPPHTSADVLHRSGDWLIYREGGSTTESIPPVHFPPVDYYALNLRTGQSQHLAVQPGGCRSAPSLSGSAFGDDGFAYITIDRSGGESRDQLRLYDLETGEDRLLLETESADTFLDSPLLRGNKVIYNQAWQGEWPRGPTPTPMPGRPGPFSWPPRYRITGDIFSLDLETGERVNLSNTGSASDPALWGDYLMWIDQPIRFTQEYGSGEVYVLNMKTGQRKRLTGDATYMHLYWTPLAGDGFFVWGDAHEAKDRLPVYFPETGEMVCLQGPGGGPTVSDGQPDGNVLFWKWSDWSGACTPSPLGWVVDREQVQDRPWRVYMTTFE